MKLPWRLISRGPERWVKTQGWFGTYFVSNKDQIVGRSLYSGCHFEQIKIEMAMNLLGAEGLLNDRQKILLDIGANLGTVCIPLIQQSYFFEAIAFEPELKNYQLLKRNIEENGLVGKIRAEPLALSSRTGNLELELSKSIFADHRIRILQGADNSDEYNESTWQVKIISRITLDDYLESAEIDSQLLRRKPLPILLK